MNGVVFTFFALGAFVAFGVIATAQTVAGSITTNTLALYGLGLPCVLAGLWSGVRPFGKITDETFRKTVLVLLLFAGLSLMLPALASSVGPLMLDPFPPSAPPM